jgi:tetratricopeptide (TPR) repeat protein
LALGIHWLAAGGIAFPGVAGSFWILLALALNVVDGEPAIDSRPSRAATRLMLLSAFGLLSAGVVACYYTAFGPVTRLHTAMAQAAQVTHPQARIVAYLEAATADPLSAEPWMMIAELEMEKLRQNRGTPASYQNFIDATAKVLDLRPHSSSTWRQIGAWYVEIYRRGQFEKAGEAAVDELRRAVELYPTSAAIRADLALALDMVGKRDVAQRQAEQSLALDEQMPHADRKLPREVRDALKALQAESR